MHVGSLIFNALAPHDVYFTVNLCAPPSDIKIGKPEQWTTMNEGSTTDQNHNIAGHIQSPVKYNPFSINEHYIIVLQCFIDVKHLSYSCATKSIWNDRTKYLMCDICACKWNCVHIYGNELMIRKPHSLTQSTKRAHNEKKNKLL